MAIALRNIGVNSRSYAGWQVPIFTDDNHGHAVISNVGVDNLRRDLDSGVVPVVCGFQGLSPENKITTLGRGGSDLTAVAVASAIEADVCEIYSDVDGVYTVDPNLLAEARKIDEIGYDEMAEMAAYGAKIMQEQSVRYAQQQNVTIRVASSFKDSGGTIISRNASTLPFCGLAVEHTLSPIKISCKSGDVLDAAISILGKHCIRAEIFQKTPLAKSIIMVEKKKTDLALNLLSNFDLIGCAKREVMRKSFSQISVVGPSIDSRIVADLTAELGKHKINAINGSSSRFRANLIVPRDKLLGAVGILHEFCGLHIGLHK
jgi:aspartate kinase